MSVKEIETEPEIILVKTCSECHIEKILKDFSPNLGCYLGVAHICKDCKNNNDRQIRKAKAECLKLGFNLRKCMVCNKQAKPGTRNYDVDHDHETGDFRLVLCGVCNRGRGNLGEHIPNIRSWCNKAEIAEAAVKMLRITKQAGILTHPARWDCDCTSEIYSGNLDRYAHRS